jgi:hypothetical protein
MTRRTVCIIPFEDEKPGLSFRNWAADTFPGNIKGFACMSDGSKPANDVVSAEELRDMLAHLRETNESTRLLLDQIVESIRSVNDTHLREFDELAARIQRKLDLS